MHNFFLFPIVKTVWPLEVLKNSALLNMLANEIHLMLVVCFANYFFLTIFKLAGYRVQPVAADCIIGWDAAFAADAVSPYQYTGAHFADLGRMTIFKLKQFEHGIPNDTVLSGLPQILPCRLTMA